MRTFAVLTLLLWMPGCAGLWGTTADECAWTRQMQLDPDWSDRLTRSEKIQIAGHNEARKLNCKN
jgi:hypothetical protein